LILILSHLFHTCNTHLPNPLAAASLFFLANRPMRIARHDHVSALLGSLGARDLACAHRPEDLT
jgi:hypothetical protein